MKRSSGVFWRPTRKSRRGQVLIFMTLWLPVLFGMAALVADFGFIYYYQNELNASTQAAALAGAAAMSQAGATAASVTATVTTYSGASGSLNSASNIPGTAILSGYPKFMCLSTLKTTFGLQCYGPSASNALQVAQQVKVPLFFLPLFGGPSATLTATATASMKGSATQPYNIAIVVDSTRSMNDTDADSNCSNTRIYCALQGVQVLLKSLSPCQPAETSCGAATSGMVSNSVDRVSLLTFPSVSTGTVADDYNCGSATPTIRPYSFPFPATSTYQILDFASDYRTSDAAASLNPGSNLVAAAGGKSGCNGLQAIGGAGTYYAQIIYTAQAYLVAEQLLNPNSQNVIVMLSDGDANATSAQMVGASTTSGLYPSTLQECHQAITAAQAAAGAGTRIYSVAYGAEASGCSTDTSPAITPCQTMEGIASSPSYFFSDYTATGGSSSCISASQPVTGLNNIFQVIATDLTEVKLIPNNTT
jgi:Flp pilus assembly protein TadG